MIIAVLITTALNSNMKDVFDWYPAKKTTPNEELLKKDRLVSINHKKR